MVVDRELAAQAEAGIAARYRIPALVSADVAAAAAAAAAGAGPA